MRKVVRLFGFAEYGWDELLLAILAAGLTGFLLWVSFGWPFALIVLPPLAIVVWFFRDPNRVGPPEKEKLLSPADGRVADIEEVEEPDFLQGRALRIGIFLSPLNVHVNRTPCAGTVKFIRAKAGEYLPAYNPHAATRNVSTSLGMIADSGERLLLKQVTGVLARRIVCEAQENQHLDRGERYGMIKFGSRTELYVPVENKPLPMVKVGDKVRGGETVIMLLSSPLEGESRRVVPHSRGGNSLSP